jgi:hypothetical protein
VLRVAGRDGLSRGRWRHERTHPPGADTTVASSHSRVSDSARFFKLAADDPVHTLPTLVASIDVFVDLTYPPPALVMYRRSSSSVGCSCAATIQASQLTGIPTTGDYPCHPDGGLLTDANVANRTSMLNPSLMPGFDASSRHGNLRRRTLREEMRMAATPLTYMC